MVTSGERLSLLKTLGDNTRYAIYLELARSPGPLSTAQVAESLGLHGNTVRPHLERMKEVGLLESRPEVTGSVGRPQKLYSLAGDAPSLGLEPPVFPMLARMLVDAARQARLDPETVVEAGRSEGRRQAQTLIGSTDDEVSDDIDSRYLGGGWTDGLPGVLADLLSMQEQLGFDPAVVVDDDLAVSDTAEYIDEDSTATAAGTVAHVAFTHCPFSELAARNPEIICSLHRGLVEGFIEARTEGTSIQMQLRSFNDVTDRDPCRMDVGLRNGRLG